MVKWLKFSLKKLYEKQKNKKAKNANLKNGYNNVMTFEYSFDTLFMPAAISIVDQHCAWLSCFLLIMDYVYLQIGKAIF